MLRRYWLYVAGGIGFVGLMWLLFRVGGQNLQVIQPSEGLPPGMRFLQVRWKAPLEEPPRAWFIPFEIEPEVPILSVSWISPTEAILHLGEGLSPGISYTLIGKGGPFRGKARFFTQPVKVVQVEGGYVWKEPGEAYQQAVYFQANASLTEDQLRGQWGSQAIVRFVSLGRNEFLAVSGVSAQKPFSGELSISHEGESIYEGEVKANAFGRFELRRAEVDFAEGRYFIRLRGNRPIFSEAAKVASYLEVEAGVEIAELEVREIEARIYLEQVPERPFGVYLRPGFPDGQEGLAEPETLQLAPPPQNALRWAQSNVHYVAQGQGLHFVVSPNIQTLRLSLWRIRPENERFFLDEMSSYSYFDSNNLYLYGQVILQGEFPVEAFPKVQSYGGLIRRALGKELTAGTYYVEMAPTNMPWSSISTWFVVSDWYLLSREWKEAVWVAAFHKTTGKPLGGVKVNLIAREGTVLQEKRTNREGVALLERSPFSTAHAVIAERAGQSLFLPLGVFRPVEWPYPTGGFDPNREPYYLYLTSARTLYRPGDTISIHGYLRTHNWRYAPEPLTLKATLRDPRMQEIFTTSVSLDNQGHFHLTYPLPVSAATGTYQFQIKLDQKSEETSPSTWSNEEEASSPEWNYLITVEFFRADRLVVDAEVRYDGPNPYLQVMGRYLYGALASFQKGEVSAKLRSATPQTPLAQGYSWKVQLPAADMTDFLKPTEFQTDANGQAKIPLPPLTGMGLVEVEATILLYDEENRPNYRLLRFQMPTQPLLIGIQERERWVMAEEPLTFNLRALSAPDYTQLAKGTHAITAEVWEVTYDYHLLQSLYDQYRTDYQTHRRRVLRTKVELREGTGELTFTPRTSATYEVLLWAPGQQYPTIYQFEAWTWGTSALKSSTEGQVLIQPQESVVTAGKEVALLLKAPLPAKALLTIEREKVWHHEWVDLSNGSATVTLEFPEIFAPGVYIHVVAFHAIGDKAVPFPTSRGMIYLPVLRQKGIAPLRLVVPERAKPSAPLILRIEAPHTPCTFVLLTGLDEGVWSKQVHKPQRPEEVFYQKWAHLVKVSEHLPMVASWGKEVIGGGDYLSAEMSSAAPSAEASLTAEAYEYAVVFEQLVLLDERGTAEVKLWMPSFSGKIRWRAYLVGESMYGSAEAFTQVAAPVVGRMGVPFYIANGEEIETQLILRNTTNQPQKGTWRIAVSSDAMEVTPAKGSYALSVGGVETIKLRYKAKQPWGLPTVTLYVNEEVAQERQIRIRPAAAARLITMSLHLEPGADTTLTLPPDLFQNPQAEARLVVSTAPISELGPALLQLLHFPHGCAEQITSQAFVSLKLTKLAGAFHPGGEDTARKHVEYVLRRLPLYKSENGFSFWPGGSKDTWLTLHVCHFLMEASQAGYAEANKLLSSLIDFLEYTVKNEPPSSYLAAYSGFLLALKKGKKAASLLPSVKQVEESRDPVVRAFWRAAFHLAKVPSLPTQRPLLFQNEEPLYYYYADADLRYWYAESFVNPSAVPTSLRARLSKGLLAPYLSTHNALWLLLVYERLYSRPRDLSGQIELGPKAIALSGNIWYHRLHPNNAQRIRLKAERDTLYMLIWAESYPVTPPPAVSEGLVITEEIIPKGGRQYVWRIRLRRSTAEPAVLENVALTVPYPSGFMLDRSSLSEESRYPSAEGLSWDYTDLREDRFLGYFRMSEREAEIALPLRLIYPGRYQIPSISAAAMYNPTIHGASAARLWQAQPF